MSSQRGVFEIRPPRLSVSMFLQASRDFFNFGDLLYTLCAHRIRIRYKQSALGVAWAILQPLAMMAVYTVIFSGFTQVPTNGVPYPIFVFSALLPWIYFSTSITSATNSLVSHQNLITKVFFPRELLPISYVVAGVFDLAIGAGVFILIGVYYQVSWGWSALWVLPLILSETILILGIGFLLAALQVRFRDIGLALPLILQLAIFACPVVYPLSSVPLRFRGWYTLNPLAVFIDSFRRIAAEHQSPDLFLLAIASAVSFVILIVGFAYLKYQETTVVDSI